MGSEADTCRKYVLPKLLAAGWDTDPHSIAEQRTFTDGRIYVVGGKAGRLRQKRADYVLRYTRDIALAVVEAKPEYKLPGDGLQQAKDYAETLGLTFAYSTNGFGIIEFDYLTGSEKELGTFPTPDELWQRLLAGSKLPKEAAARLVTPGLHAPGKTPRYYQEIAINRALEHILSGKRRTLLTLATGTGKTYIAFRICWRLWNSRWTRNNEYRRPRILYLSDRNILADDPKVKDFKPFEAAAWKIENGVVNKSREMYFAIYQAPAKDDVRPGLYREYPRDFFDLVVVDECHRGSARDDYGKLYFSILDYTGSATRLFADPGFDGEPEMLDETQIDDNGVPVSPPKPLKPEPATPPGEGPVVVVIHDREAGPRKYYVDGGIIQIATQLVYELDSDGKQLRVMELTDYAAEKVRKLFPNSAELRKKWADAGQRTDIILQLAERLRKEEKRFFEKYQPEARQILDELLEKYAEFGAAQFDLPDILKVPPISEHGRVTEIAARFGGPDKLREAVSELQALLYAA